MHTAGRVLWAFISVVMMLLAIDFAISNNGMVSLALWPLSSHIILPMWLFGVAAFIIGGFFGTILMWGSVLAIRTKLWQIKSQNRKLQEIITRHSVMENGQNSPTSLDRPT